MFNCWAPEILVFNYVHPFCQCMQYMVIEELYVALLVHDHVLVFPAPLFLRCPMTMKVMSCCFLFLPAAVSRILIMEEFDCSSVAVGHDLVFLILDYIYRVCVMEEFDGSLQVMCALLISPLDYSFCAFLMEEYGGNLLVCSALLIFFCVFWVLAMFGKNP